MSQQPQEPNAKSNEGPSPSSSSPAPKPRAKLSPIMRAAIAAGVLAGGLLLLWTLVGEELYDQVQAYREAMEGVDSSAPVGYIGLNYRKEYNSRPPQFHFEEDGKTLLWASIGDGETPDFYDVTEAEFDPQILQGGFGRDSIPGVDYPILQGPDGEIASNISDSNEVAGVVLDDGPRAYPLGALRKVEVVNDVDGGVPIAVVYARGPDWVMVYRREVDGQALTLGTTGYATNEKIPLFYDRKTKSLWLPEPDGKALTCVNGEYAGTRLSEYTEAERLPWGDWLDRYPETRVLVGNDRDRPIPED